MGAPRRLAATGMLSPMSRAATSIFGEMPMWKYGAAIAFALFAFAADAQIPDPIQAPFYFNGVPVTASATGTNAAATATIPAVASRTAYLCGFSIRSSGTAAAATATVTGTISGTLNFLQGTPATPAVGVVEPNFGSICIAASAPNTAIAVVSATPGTGTVTVSAWGFYGF